MMSIIQAPKNTSLGELDDHRPEEDDNLSPTALSPVTSNRDNDIIGKLTRTRREKHYKVIDNFEKVVDFISEECEADVLRLVSEIRDQLEESDQALRLVYKDLDSYDYLIVRQESDLLMELESLKQVIQARASIVNKLAYGLESIERDRGHKMAAELKNLVDTLISIAYQLPNEIEHIIEEDVHELNAVIIQNLNNHDELLFLLRKNQIEVEIEALQRWENGRKTWRKIRHEKAVKDYDVDIHSERFFHPIDRTKCLNEMQSALQQRHGERHILFRQLSEMTALTMSSTEILTIKEQFQALSDQEVETIQECYDTLQDLRKDLQHNASMRTEVLRKELHVYGALSIDPNRHDMVEVLERCLNNDHTQDLFRQASGLKLDLVTIARDLEHEDIVYDRHVNIILEKAEIIESGFVFRSVMRERGREGIIDRYRNLVAKLRVVPPEETNAFVESLATDLEDLVVIDTLPSLFTRNLAMLVNEMQVALAKAKEEKAATERSALSPNASNLSVATVLKATSKFKSTLKSSLNTGSSTKGRTSRRNSAILIGIVDYNQIKAWHKKLTALLFSCDLPAEVQDICHKLIISLKTQKESNRLVDEVVHERTARILARMDQEYLQIINNITNYLESQASKTSAICMNLANFFIILAKRIERNRVTQESIDEASKDELWDLSEDYRLESEDCEAEFLHACQALRGSVDEEQLEQNFAKVLTILEKIKASYQAYYDKVCFASDKYPLRVIDEYRRYLVDLSTSMMMRPADDHAIFSTAESIYHDLLRLNKRFIELDANAIKDLHDPVEAADKLLGAKGIFFQSPEKSTAETASFTGKYQQYVTNEALFEKFCKDGAYVDQSAKDDDIATDNVSPEIPAAAKTDIDEQRDDYPFLKKESTIIIKSPEQIAGLDEDAKYEYDHELSAALIEIPDIDTLVRSNQLQIDAFNATNNSKSKAKSKASTDSTITSLPIQVTWTSDESLLASYRSVRSYVADVAANDAKHLHAQRFLKPVAISENQIFTIYQVIRQEIISTVEAESFSRLASAKSLTSERKSAYTEELEDRIRLHWPRRGRIETQIKQPRLGEIRSHQEKTYRYVVSIQDRMKDLKANLLQLMDKYKDDRLRYIDDINELQASVKDAGAFKSLATLQAVDVKARARMTLYQHQRDEESKAIVNLITHDPNNIINYAKDFRKICPLQNLGQTIETLSEEALNAGYSLAELEIIDGLINQQCQEITEIAGDWKANVDELFTHDDEAAKIYESFIKAYEICAHELALAEGLGQKYGAPRRRAQERIRTELSRDEMNAKRIDQVLAEIESLCTDYEQRPEINRQMKARDGMDLSMMLWTKLAGLRQAFYYRLQYLQLWQSSSSPQLSTIEWIQDNHIAAAASTPLTDPVTNCPISQSSMTLNEVIDDMERICHQETKELYAADGKPGFIPPSLIDWLAESRSKIFGREGYREREWKHLWQQIQRYDAILCRRLLEDDDQSTSSPSVIPATSTCIRALCQAFILYIEELVEQEDRCFNQNIRPLEPLRDSHERLLRPRLGSEGAVDELNALNDQEARRSSTYSNAVLKYRSQLATILLKESKRFVEDISVCSQALLVLIDSAAKQETMQVPPDTIIPKKRLTAKRMRKAQRLRQMVSEANSSPSTAATTAGSNNTMVRERIWPSIGITALLTALGEATSMIVDENDGTESVTSVNSMTNRSTKKTATKPPSKAIISPKLAAPAPAPVPANSLTAWAEEIRSKSSINAGISTAHRLVIKERDEGIDKFSNTISKHIESIRSRCDRYLATEESWRERWNRQVNLLRQGDLW
jgi:hypothetical protein